MPFPNHLFPSLPSPVLVWAGAPSRGVVTWEGKRQGSKCPALPSSGPALSPGHEAGWAGASLGPWAS